MEATFYPLPVEVVGVILKNLGKTDFLNSRLVCRLWNKEALTQLKRSKFRQKLNEQNAGYFILFALKSSCQLPLPLYIRYNFNERDKADAQELEMRQFVSIIETLQNLFGSKCIRGLDLWIFPTMNTLSILIEVLAKLSPTLEGLGLWSFKMRGQIDITSLKTNLNPMVFPNLKNLYLMGVNLMNPGLGREAQILVCSHLIEAIPILNLAVFSLPRGMTSEELLISPDRIKRMNSILIEDRN